MIARLWRGYGTQEKANGYRVMLLRQILPSINKSDGYRGSFVLERQINGEIEFLIITFGNRWRQSGNSPARRMSGLVIQKEAAAFLTRYDTESIHYLCHENK
jgi:hypothetical protein